MWFHANNQIASLNAMLCHIPLLLCIYMSFNPFLCLASFHTKWLLNPGWLPYWPSSPLPFHPTPHLPGPFSYFVNMFFIQLPLSTTSSFFYLLKAWPSFNIWVMSPPFHKVLLNYQNFHSFIQKLLNTYYVRDTAVSIGIERGTKQTRLYCHKKINKF